MTQALPGWLYPYQVADLGGGGATVRRYRSDSLCSDDCTPSSPLIHPACLLDEDEDGRRCEVANGLRAFEERNRRSVGNTCAAVDIRHLRKQQYQDRAQLSLLALLLAALRRSLLVCKATKSDICLEIGCPTNVRHVTHVTFDRFNGFLGLPIEFEVEIPRRAPSASASVFGVSAESMQCSYDRKGNSVPTILLLIQDRLYREGGLQAEGIFRINAENSHEEEVRQQLNKGIVPHGVDLHCLAGLIKAWFRELPKGVLDCLAPEEVMQCSSEEECVDLVKQLPPTESALLDWAINLMADVVQEEEYNKMNAHNIAMVFAPNMTQMADPMTALLHAVQVMNFLKTLILRTIQERQEAALDPRPVYMCTVSSFDDDFDADNASPFFVAHREEECMENEIIQEALMAPFNSPNRKGSPNGSNSGGDPGEVFVLDLNGRIVSVECDGQGKESFCNGSSSTKGSKASKGESKERGHLSLVYPDDGRAQMREKDLDITNHNGVILRQKSSTKYQRSGTGQRTGSIKLW